MGSPGNYNEMTELEWLEREQEKEMIELAMERSMNDFQTSNRRDGLTQGGPLHSSMPINYHSSHSGSAADHTRPYPERRAPHSRHVHQNSYGRYNEGPRRDRMCESERIGSTRTSHHPGTNRMADSRIGSMRHLGHRSDMTPDSRRRRISEYTHQEGYPDYTHQENYREVQVITERLLDSPHHSYESMTPTTPTSIRSMSNGRERTSPSERPPSLREVSDHSPPSTYNQGPRSPRDYHGSPHDYNTRRSPQDYSRRLPREYGERTPQLRDYDRDSERDYDDDALRPHDMHSHGRLDDRTGSQPRDYSRGASRDYESDALGRHSDSQQGRRLPRDFDDRISQPRDYNRGSSRGYESGDFGQPTSETPRTRARKAVLETARQHLTREEVQLVEDALGLSGRAGSGARGNEQSGGSFSNNGNVLRTAQHTDNDMTESERRQLEMALHASRIEVNQHQQHAPRPPSLSARETMDLLSRASAAQYLTQDELDEIERGLNEATSQLSSNEAKSQRSSPPNPEREERTRQHGRNPQQHERTPQRRQEPRAAPRPQRTISGDSLALARQEIERAAAANTLSPGELAELMMALGPGGSRTSPAENADGVHRSPSSTRDGTTASSRGSARSTDNQNHPRQSRSSDGVSHSTSHRSDEINSGETEKLDCAPVTSKENNERQNRLEASDSILTSGPAPGTSRALRISEEDLMRHMMREESEESIEGMHEENRHATVAKEQEQQDRGEGMASQIEDSEEKRTLQQPGDSAQPVAEATPSASENPTRRAAKSEVVGLLQTASSAESSRPPIDQTRKHQGAQLSTALATLPYVRGAPQGPRSGSIDMEYSVSQFGDSNATGGIDMEYSVSQFGDSNVTGGSESFPRRSKESLTSLLSSEPDNSRQQQQQRKQRRSTEPVLGDNLLPPSSGYNDEHDEDAAEANLDSGYIGQEPSSSRGKRTEPNDFSPRQSVTSRPSSSNPSERKQIPDDGREAEEENIKALSISIADAARVEMVRRSIPNDEARLDAHLSRRDRRPGSEHQEAALPHIHSSDQNRQAHDMQSTNLRDRTDQSKLDGTRRNILPEDLELHGQQQLQHNAPQVYEPHSQKKPLRVHEQSEMQSRQLEKLENHSVPRQVQLDPRQWTSNYGRQGSMSSLGDSTFHSLHSDPGPDEHRNLRQPHSLPVPPAVREPGRPEWGHNPPIQRHASNPRSDSRQPSHALDQERFHVDLQRAIRESYEMHNRPLPSPRDEDRAANPVDQRLNQINGLEGSNPSGAGDSNVDFEAADAALARALQEAKDEEERESLLLARQLQEEDERRASRVVRSQTATPATSAPRAARVGAFGSSSPVRQRHPLEEEIPTNVLRGARVGAFESSSPVRQRHPLEEEIRGVDSSGGGVLRPSSQTRPGAHQSSSPQRVRHPLEDSYSSLSPSGNQRPERERAHLDEPSSSPMASSDIHSRQRGHQRLQDSLSPLRGNQYQETAREALGEPSSSQRPPHGYQDLTRQSDTAPPPPPHGHSFDSTEGGAGEGGRGSESSPENQQLPSDATRRGKPPVGLFGPGSGITSPYSSSKRDNKMLGPVARIGSKTVGSLLQTMKRTSQRAFSGSNSNLNGAAASGNADTPDIFEVLDVEARVQVDRAINKGVINHLNGVVKCGNEATIIHADRGPESGGFDVAIKVFKRAQGHEANQAGKTHDLSQFQNISSKKQLEMWTVKEYRNLKRAKRAGVPCPAPILARNNLLFMQFVGTDARPFPQLGELDLRRGHKRWKPLYNQIIDAIRKLYTSALLVHGNMSERNVLVVPCYFWGDDGADSNSRNPDGEQVVLIDFCQTVDSKHPDGMELLRRDLQAVRHFFVKQGVRTPSVDDTLKYVTGGTASKKFDEMVSR